MLVVEMVFEETCWKKGDDGGSDQGFYRTGFGVESENYSQIHQIHTIWVSNVLNLTRQEFTRDVEPRFYENPQNLVK